MTGARSLPPVVGSTENALRALLESLLASTPLESAQHWIALNVAAGASREDAISKTLKTDLATTRDLLAGLSSAGLLEHVADTWRATTKGAELIRELSITIAVVTDGLVLEAPPEDIDTTIRVLNQLRTNAEQVLTRRCGTPS